MLARGFKGAFRAAALVDEVSFDAKASVG